MKLKNPHLRRLILVDLDGTVLQKNGQTIHPKTLEVLQQATKDGHTVCILTGRPQAASIEHYETLGLNTLIANFDGAHIHDPEKKQFKRIVLPISYEIKNDILSNPVIQEKTNNVLVEYYETAMLNKPDPDIEAFFHLPDHETDTLKYGNPLTEWNNPTNNIILKVNDEASKDEVLRALSEYKDSVKIQSDNLYGMTRELGDNRPIISLTNKLGNKGLAAEIMAQYYNKDIRDVIAFGDQMNDYTMITKVGHGIAMKNGSDNLKIVADGITWKTNDEGGLGYYLEALLAGKEV